VHNRVGAILCLRKENQHDVKQVLAKNGQKAVARNGLLEENVV